MRGHHHDICDIHRLSSLKKITLPRLSENEISPWLHEMHTSLVDTSSVNIGDFMSVTGGVPSLVKGFFNFIDSKRYLRDINIPILNQYSYIKTNSGMMREVQKYVRYAREYPNVWNHITQHKGSLVNLSIERNSMKGLVNSGVVDLDTRTESCKYTSSIFEERIKLLMSSSSLSLLGIKPDLDELFKSKTIRTMKKWPEFFADPAYRALCSTRIPDEVFAKVARLLLPMKTHVCFYMRDLDNRHLWHSLNNTDETRTIPLKGDKYGDFATAIKLGSSHVADNDMFYIPITGNTGMVEIVVKGHFSKAYDKYSYKARLECVEGILKSIKPILANTHERHSLMRSKKYSDYLIYEYKGKAENSYAALKDFGCIAISIYERSETTWRIRRYEYVDDINTFVIPWLSRTSLNGIDRIANYRTGAGLVIDQDQLQSIFPDAPASRYRAYVRPVMKGRSVVVFIFDNNKSSDIDGTTQKHLGMVAMKLTG